MTCENPSCQDDYWDLLLTNGKLLSELSNLKKALEYYASREVYEYLNQFPGDNELVICSHIAEDALNFQRESGESI